MVSAYVWASTSTPLILNIKVSFLVVVSPELDSELTPKRGDVHVGTPSVEAGPRLIIKIIKTSGLEQMNKMNKRTEKEWNVVFL